MHVRVARSGLLILLAVVSLDVSLDVSPDVSLHAQGRGGRGGPPPPPPTAKAGAPIDLTGYWVSIVSEDWRFRMLTPAKGDHPDFLLNPEGTKIADAWDPAKDEAA